MGKRILVFSYGSGMASTLYSLRVTGDVTQLVAPSKLDAQLADRVAISPATFVEVGVFCSNDDDCTVLTEHGHFLSNICVAGAPSARGGVRRAARGAREPGRVGKASSIPP